MSIFVEKCPKSILEWCSGWVILIIVKQKAYDLLLENNIDRPLQFSDLENICSKNDWSLLPYKGHERLIHKIGMDKMMDYDGFTYRAKQGTDTITIIFFRDTLGQARRIHVVAHEIGHLVLNHMYQTSASFSLVDVPHEQEAEEFAFEMELPSCVSKRAHFNTPSKFRMHGDWIPSSIAYHISENSDPYSSVPENAADILSLYSKFINRCIKKKRMRLFITSILLVLGCICS